MVSCTDVSLSMILSVVKRILQLIQIIVPILLLIFSTISFIRLMKNPEEKNGIKKIINQFIAAAVIFFIPTIINITIYLIGERTNFSSCWMNAPTIKKMQNTYYTIGPEKERKKIYSNAADYEKGSQSDGKAIAELAVRVVPNAEPDPRIIHHANLHMGVDRATITPIMHNYIKIMDATTTKQMVGDWNGNPKKHYFNNPNAATAHIDFGYNNNTYCSCTQATGAIIRATVDPDFDMSGDPTTYFKNHPEKWEMVGYIRAGEKFDDVCQPGDVLSVQRAPITTHVMLYVGHELVKQRFPNSNANIYQGGYNASDEEKSWCPHLDYMEKVDERRQYYEIWRPTGEGEFYYPFIDVDEVLASPLHTGSFW